MFTSVPETSWFILNVKPRLLRKVVDFLNKRHLEHYCPFLSIHPNWDDRRRNNQQPLFPSYVFVREKAIQQEILTRIQGSVNLVYWLDAPATITGEEVIAIKTFLDTYQHVSFEKCAITVPEEVKVVKETVIRKEGNIVHVSGIGATMQLPSIGYNLIGQTANRESVSMFKAPLNKSISDFYDFRIKNAAFR
ncbi:MAG: transcription termination/antitermination NusG family protein [Agriterribacter sp.]